MRPFLPILLLVAGAPVMLCAQGAAILNQAFQLHYNRWQIGQGAVVSATQATYDFSLGLPVLSYRLGALALSGSMDYNRASNGAWSDSAVGLDRYGVRFNLFPYRPFHISMDYSHSQSPGLAGMDRVTGEVYGLGLIYRGRTIQDLQMNFRHGSNAQADAREDWSLYTLAANQDFGRTRFTLRASRQVFGSAADALQWRSSSLFAGTETPLGKAWRFRTALQTDDAAGSRSLGMDLDLTGTPSRWTSISSLSMDRNQGAGWEGASTLLSQSLTLNSERFTSFGSLALSSIQNSALAEGSQRGTMLIGGAYSLGQGWRVSADVGQTFGATALSGASSQNGQRGVPGSRNMTTVHTGISQGGDVPGIIKRTLFFLSDWNFYRQVTDDYPPGYVPSELAGEMARRRFRQSGQFSVAGDVWHITPNGGQGQMDWGRLTSQFAVNAGLSLVAIGDWKRDEGIALPGIRMESQALTLNGAYRLGVSVLNASIGSSRNRSVLAPGTSPPGMPIDPAQLTPASASRAYAAGFSSQITRMLPYGIQWTRYDDGLQLPVEAVSTYVVLNFRQISLRVNWETARRSDGFHSERITVDLLRWFDTMALWGFGSGW